MKKISFLERQILLQKVFRPVFVFYLDFRGPYHRAPKSGKSIATSKEAKFFGKESQVLEPGGVDVYRSDGRKESSMNRCQA